jgi:disease resistance protein RPM1
MAEAVVGVLIGKLVAALAKEAATYGASVLGKEASAIKGLFGEIRMAEEELKSMKAYLRESEKFRDADETNGIFVNKIRELSFRIEDVVDEFMYKLEDSKHGGYATKTKKRIKHVKDWRRLALELKNINAELKEAAERRHRYARPRTESYNGSSDHQARSTNQALCFAREEDLVGIEGYAAKLKGWLVDDLEERNTKIITVWGMGGVGKTTLVHHVYKTVKLDFDATAWITVSKSYQAEDLLRKIAVELGILINCSNMDMIRAVDVIRNHLEGKRCVLVLDDVWEQNVWVTNIMHVFTSNCTSRFVLTSRLSEVGSLATNNCAIELKPLQQNHSYMLFCKLAFWNDDEKRCPEELHDLASKFLQKCQGLPIAISCIGRLLSCKHPTYSEWKNVYEKLELGSTKNMIPGVETILKVSLEDLPYKLKNCFLHCAIFPEDYILTRRRLIRHWITSGFIKEKENKTLEQVAEGYLSDLVNRSLLQVVKKNESGRLKYCRMHDVIRLIAIEKAVKECFGIVYQGHGTFPVHGTRRLSIQSANIALSNQSGALNLRAAHFFTSSVDIGLLRSILATSILLSTLDLQGTEIKMLPNEVFSLFNLRFLGLRDTRIEILPEAIGRLQNLEVLDTAHTCLLSLPKNVAKLRKLRYLYATVEVAEGYLIRRRGIKVPRGIRNLIGLHVLQNVKATSETLCDIAALTELRKLGVDDVTSEHSLCLRSAVLNMSNLVSLVIKSSNGNEVLPLEELCLPGTLSKLGLTGKLEKKGMPRILSSWLHLNNLSHLDLTFSKLDECSFPNLMVLHNLCFLALYKAYDGKALFFSVQSFPSLRQLKILGASQLNQVEIEEGALGSLNKLRFSECPELKRLPQGIEYLAALCELDLIDAADEFTEMLMQESEANECKEELVKISHVRNVFITSTEKKFRRRIVSTKDKEFTF